MVPTTAAQAAPKGVFPFPGDWPDDSTAPTPASTPRDVSAVPISSFKTRFETLPDDSFTVASWLGFIRDGLAAEPIARIRAARGSAAYDTLKQGLRTATWAGLFSGGRKANDPFIPSGLVFLEIDNHSTAPPEGWLTAEKQRLSSNPGTVAVYTSAGGRGLHVLAAADPVPTTPAEYRQAWGWLTRELALEETSDPMVKNLGRLAGISHDPDCYLNLTPTPIRWEPNALGSTGPAEARARYTPSDTAEALRMIAAHYGVEWTGATQADAELGIRLFCPYHNGNNPSALHVWQGEQELVTKKGELTTVPAMHARCYSRECPGPIVLRFLGREVGFEWPIKVGTYWQADVEDALADTLSLLRVDMRLNRGSGQIEIRPWEGSKPDRIIVESGIPYRTGWSSIGGSVFEQAVRMLARRSFKLDGNAGDWLDAFMVSASASPFSNWPFREYLEQLPKWDKIPRLGALFTSTLGAAYTKLNRTAAKAFAVGAVRRTYEPGCVHDWLPVLVGEQGLGKSRFCRSLLPPEHELALYGETWTSA